MKKNSYPWNWTHDIWVGTRHNGYKLEYDLFIYLLTVNTIVALRQWRKAVSRGPPWGRGPLALAVPGHDGRYGEVCGARPERAVIFHDATGPPQLAVITQLVLQQHQGGATDPTDWCEAPVKIHPNGVWPPKKYNIQIKNF